MKKQIAKSISILSLLLVLSAGAVNVPAFPICKSTRCQEWLAARAPAPKETQVPIQDPGGQATLPTAQPESAFNFAFFLVRLAMSFPYLP